MHFHPWDSQYSGWEIATYSGARAEPSRTVMPGWKQGFSKGWRSLIAACLGLVLAACSETTAPVASDANRDRGDVTASVNSANAGSDPTGAIETPKAGAMARRLGTADTSPAVVQMNGYPATDEEMGGPRPLGKTTRNWLRAARRRSNYAVAF